MQGAKVIKPEQIRIILEKVSPREKVLLLSGLLFGTRISESLSLKFADVQGDSLTIQAKKGGDKRSYPIPDQFKKAVQDLETYYHDQGKNIQPETFLFLSKKGENQPITSRQGVRLIQELTNSLNMEGISSHSFRKYFITQIYEKTGKDLIQTRIYSRHKNLSNLTYYIQTTEQTDLVKDISW